MLDFRALLVALVHELLVRYGRRRHGGIVPDFLVVELLQEIAMLRAGVNGAPVPADRPVGREGRLDVIAGRDLDLHAPAAMSRCTATIRNRSGSLFLLATNRTPVEVGWHDRSDGYCDSRGPRRVTGGPHSWPFGA